MKQSHKLLIKGIAFIIYISIIGLNFTVLLFSNHAWSNSIAIVNYLTGCFLISYFIVNWRL